MTQEALLQRAQLLMEQGRVDQAAETLQQLLAADPNDATAHALLSLCLSGNRDRWHDATREAEQAIHLAPDDGLSHYAHSAILEKRNRFEESTASAREAVRLDPYNAYFYGHLASTLAQQSKWQEALDTASTGLEVDPEDERCTTIRALALERLGRRSDASEQAEAAVRRNPDSADAHAMRGWTLMQNGEHKKAQEAFREALRLEPTNEFARSGMIQALNNDHLLFRWVFRFYSFMGRLGKSAQWAIIIGLFIGMRLLRALAEKFPVLGPYVLPISLLYLAFCMLSWIADPLFNTFLRFHPLGKFLLSDKQRWTSNLIAGCIALGSAGALAQGIRGDIPGAVVMFLAPLFMTLPFSILFEVDRGWPRVVTMGITAILGLLCLSTMALVLTDGPWVGPYLLFALGVMLFSFAGNMLRSVTVQH